jgi:ParB/RepB/Spo0J family partition protein
MTTNTSNVSSKGMPEPAKKRRVETRLIATLKPHPLQAQVFSATSDEEMRELAADIKRNGLLHSVEVTVEGMIICGHERVRAAQHLRWTKIRCWIRDELTTPEAVEQRLIEDNLHRRQLGKLAVAQCYRRLRQLSNGENKPRGSGDVRDLLAERFHVSGRTLDRWEQLLDSPMEIQQAVDEGRLALTLASKVVTLSSKHQQVIVQQILAGEDAQRVVRHALAKHSRRSPLSVGPDLTRLLRGLERDVDALEGLDLTSELEVRPEAVSILLRTQQLIGQIVAAIDGRDSEIPIPRKPRARRQQGAR